MAQLVKNLPAMQETWVQSLGGKVPWRQGRSPGDRKGYPLQYSGLKNSMDCIVHEEAKSWTKLSDFHFQRWDTDKNTTYISASFTQMLVIQSGL